jgi:uncharacterized protein (TIGR00369 family)
MTQQISSINAELFRKANSAFKKVPFVKLLGMELSDLKDSEAVVKLKVRDDLRQPHGLLHGGATASLIDTAMAFAVVTKLSEDEKASTVDLNVYYLRPVIDGEIFCKAKVVKNGKRLMTISAEVFDESEKLVATALSTYAKV